RPAARDGGVWGHPGAREALLPRRLPGAVGTDEAGGRDEGLGGRGVRVGPARTGDPGQPVDGAAADGPEALPRPHAPAQPALPPQRPATPPPGLAARPRERPRLREEAPGGSGARVRRPVVEAPPLPLHAAQRTPRPGTPLQAPDTPARTRAAEVAPQDEGAPAARPLPGRRARRGPRRKPGAHGAAQPRDATRSLARPR